MTESSFEVWMAAVGREVSLRVGLSIHDLADCNYRDWYDSGISPAEAALMALANEGFGDEDGD